MKKNKKYTTIALYACMVVLFAVICVYFLLGIDKNRYSDLFGKINDILLKILIGAVVAYILNPIVNFFEHWVFVKPSARKVILDRRKLAKARGEKMPLVQIFDETGKLYEQRRREEYEEALKKYRENEKRQKKRRFFAKKEPTLKLHPFRGLSVLCTVLIFFGIIGLLIWAVAPQISQTATDLVAQLTDFSKTVYDKIQKLSENEMIAGLMKTLSDNGIDLVAKLREMSNSLIDLLNKTPQFLLNTATSLWQGLYSSLIGLIFAIYFLFSKELLLSQSRTFLESFFPDKVCYWVKFIINDIDLKFGKFIEGKLIDSLIIGILSFIIFIIFDLPYAAMIALIVGVTNVIPFFGPFMGAIPSAAIILITEPNKTILFIVLIIIIQQLDGNLIGPYILGDSLELPPVWIMSSIIIMGGLFGLFGMFFGVPIFAVILTIIKEMASISRKKKAAKTAAANAAPAATAPDTDADRDSPESTGSDKNDL